MTVHAPFFLFLLVRNRMIAGRMIVWDRLSHGWRCGSDVEDVGLKTKDRMGSSEPSGHQQSSEERRLFDS